MAEEAFSDVLYETRHHASGPCSSNYPPRQLNDGASKGFLSMLSARGLSQLKEKWTGNRQSRKLKRWASLFVSPKGELVAVAVGNYITMLRKDDDYQQPCGTYTSCDAHAFTVGAWSESHDVLGVVDDVDNLYFIKSNGEEMIRIEQRHLKISLPIVGIFVPNGLERKGAYLCTFDLLTSDGSLYHIEISQDISATLSSMRSWSDIKRQYPLNFLCLDYNLEQSLLALVGGPTTTAANTGSGSYSLSLWRWRQNTALKLVNSIQFEGCYSKWKGFSGQLVSPKMQISPQAKFIAALDLRGCLNIFKLDGDLFFIASGEDRNLKTISDKYPVESYFLDDIVDFIWWSDHVCTIAKKGGAVIMFDVISGKKLVENGPSFSMPVTERPNSLVGKIFIYDIPLLKESMTSADSSEVSYIFDEEWYTEQKKNLIGISRLSWKLVSFSERSVLEMYHVLINNQSYKSALDFAHHFKLDKDQAYKSQWLHSEQGTYEVHTVLTNIKDEAFVLGECVERVGGTEDTVRALLAYGLDLTDRYKDFQAETNNCDHVWDFRLSRLQLLQFRDRLETFLGINMGRFSVQEYSKFRVMPIHEAAVKLAENGKIGALNLLFKRHPFSSSPFILNILTAIPETIQVQTYSQLLPGRSPPSSTAVREKDWVECSDMVNHIKNLPESDGRAMLVRTEPIIKQLSGISWPSTNEIVGWYKDRARDIDKYSGQLENSICLLDYGCRKGMHELQRFFNDITYLQQLVYSEDDEEDIHSSIGLIEWEGLSDYEKFKAMVKDAKEENVVERLRDRAVPFMQSKFHSNISVEEEDEREDTFLVRWLKEIAGQNNIEICSVVIDEWCRDFRSGFFTNEAEAVDCALQCVYSCGATDKWNTMASILSKLLNSRGGEIRFGDLEQKLKLAEGHIEAGRLLALYQVSKPVTFFLEAHNDDKGVKQILRLILSKFARRQPGRTDNDWATMWHDLQCLHEKAFPFLDLEYILMEFCRGLLKAGRFSLARNYLKGAGAVSLPTDKAEHLVIQTAREYFFSASSLSSSEIWKARDCLDLFPNSLNVRLEADIIDALTVKLPNLGVSILPLQYKQIKDPMQIIKMAITSQAGAYINVDELIEVAKLLGLRSQEEISSIQEAIAREAAVAGDLQLAYDLCLTLVRKGHGLVWDLCAAIARGPEIDGMDVNSRKQLLSFSLCHCDDESIGDLLLAWKDLDLQGQTESLMVLTATTPDFSGLETQSLLFAEYSEDQEALLSKTKNILSKVAKNIHVANGTSWDNFLRENGKVLAFASVQLPWLVELSCKSEFGKKFHPSALPGKHYVSVRMQAVITILYWLAKNGFAPRDDLISSLANAIMEPPVSDNDDVIGCSFLLNLIDAFHGVEVIEEQLRTREDYQETCSIMNVGMIYSLLHNSGTECKDPLKRRELLLRKLKEKINADDLEKVDKAQSTFWRGWKLRLEEQKQAADRTQILEELIPGVDSDRFLSGDSHYIRSVFMSTIESMKSQKKTILRDILKLADIYSFDRVEVLLKFLSSVLVSEAWSNEEIAAEISEFKGEILESASEVIITVISTVYPGINGCNKVRLAYLFSLLSECYLQLGETRGLPSSLTQDPDKLGNFFKVLEQECCRVSFIKDLNFKNIADLEIGSLNVKNFSNEVYEHVNKSTVEALAKMVQMLLHTCTGTIPEDLISWKDVYRHHVQTELKNLENRARKFLVESPDDLQSWLSDFEQTYDACRKHIKILEHQGAMFIIQQYLTGIIPPHVFKERVHNDLTSKDCLIVLLNFWTRLSDDMLEIAEGLEEKFNTECLMVCVKVFLRLVMEAKVIPSQGWDTVYYYADHSLLSSPSEYFGFCKAMVLSGCGFDSVDSVFSEVILQCSSHQTLSVNTKVYFHDIGNFYLNILETILSNLVNDSGEQENLQNLLFSLSRLEGDLHILKRVRTAVWETLAKFADKLELPKHVRVHVLEVLQFILGRNVMQGANITPWEDWDDWICTSKNAEVTAEHVLPNQPDVSSSRFKNTLIALKTTEKAASISPHLEITSDDLLTIDSAVSCFLKLCEAADTQTHFDTLLAILHEWENLFMVEKTEEAPVKAASDMGNNWSDDWDEGWDSFHDDEQPVRKEKTESSLSIHPLHSCWTEILKRLIKLSGATETMKILDRSLERPDIVLLDEGDARNLCEIVNSDCFMALKLALLLPYESIQLWCLDAVEDTLKQGGFPESNEDSDLLTLFLSSGIISTIISKPSLGAMFSYICYLVGKFSRQSQEAQLARVNQRSGNNEDGSFYVTFQNVLFPCFVSELVRADQQVLAGFLLAKFMHTNPSLNLVNIAEASLKRYLVRQLQLPKDQGSAGETRRYPPTLQLTLLNMEGKLKNLIQSALSSLRSSS